MATDNKYIEIGGVMFELVPVYFADIRGTTEVTLDENWSGYEEWGYVLKPVKLFKPNSTVKKGNNNND